MQLDVGNEPYLSQLKVPAYWFGILSIISQLRISRGLLLWQAVKMDFFSSDFLTNLNFGQVTDEQTESDADAPIVHKDGCAQNYNDYLKKHRQMDGK